MDLRDVDLTDAEQVKAFARTREITVKLDLEQVASITGLLMFGMLKDPNLRNDFLAIMDRITEAVHADGRIHRDEKDWPEKLSE